MFEFEGIADDAEGGFGAGDTDDFSGDGVGDLNGELGTVIGSGDPIDDERGVIRTWNSDPIPQPLDGNG